MIVNSKQKIAGMHCASCAVNIEKTLSKIDGVKKVGVNYGTETAVLSFDDTLTSLENLSDAVAPLGYRFIFEKNSNLSQKQIKEIELKEMKNNIIILLPMALISVFVMGYDFLGRFNESYVMNEMAKTFFHHLLPIFSTYALFVVGVPFLKGVYNFIKFKKANMDTLVGLGTGAAFLYSFILSAFENTLKPFLNTEHNYYDVVIVVIFFISLGKYLEAKSKMKTNDAVEKLLNLSVKKAFIVRDGVEMEVKIEEVKVGDLVVIKPGEKVSVDGIVENGETYIDESMITGESKPMKKNLGSQVYCGTLNGSGVIRVVANSAGDSTLLRRIIKMVEEAEDSKAPIQSLADKISAVFVPTVLVLAFLSLVVWLVVGSRFYGFTSALYFGLSSFVGMLVIACPCALGLATPTAIIVGVGKGAKEGILVKDAATLEKLCKVNVVVMDKTGTLTKGEMSVEKEEVFSLSSDQALRIVASLEKNSSHPLARAILEYSNNKKTETATVDDFENVGGFGVKGKIKNKEYFVGNIAFVKKMNLILDEELIRQTSVGGLTPVVLFDEEKVLAAYFVGDSVKDGAKETVLGLKKMGIKVVMMTGDVKEVAEQVGKSVLVDEVVAEMLPEDKMKKIKDLRENNIVAMVGDGVNDAPALSLADVGIAMSTGTDVAISSSGLTLLNGDISKILKAFHLSRITMSGIKQNLFWAFIYNIIGIPLAGGWFYPIFGWLLNPVFAGIAMAFSSVSVVFNSLRLKNKKI